jgi:hypothetical protein
MPVGLEMRGALTGAALDIALQRLMRSQEVVTDARNALVAILALDVASLLGLITVVATLAAGNLMHAPGGWWIPGLALVASGAVALSGFLGGKKNAEADPGSLLAKALAMPTDQEALNAFGKGLSDAAKRNLIVSNRLEGRGVVAILCFLGALVLALVPIWVNFSQVFPV